AAPATERAGQDPEEYHGDCEGPMHAGRIAARVPCCKEIDRKPGSINWAFAGSPHPATSTVDASPRLPPGEYHRGCRGSLEGSAYPPSALRRWRRGAG